MKWRIRADIILSDESKAVDIFENLKKERDKFETINRGELNEERSRVELEKCYHDEELIKPCEIIETIESE